MQYIFYTIDNISPPIIRHRLMNASNARTLRNFASRKLYIKSGGA